MCLVNVTIHDDYCMVVYKVWLGCMAMINQMKYKILLPEKTFQFRNIITIAALLTHSIKESLPFSLRHFVEL